MKFRDNIFLYVLVPLIIFLVSFSYLRFIVAHDYMVAYEGACDPVTNNCFIGCEDDVCTKEYYYTKVQKYAADLYAQCSEDITGCEAANECFPINDRKCSVTYCDLEIDGTACKVQVEKPSVLSNDQVQSGILSNS